MTIVTISQKYPSNSDIFDGGDWGFKYLGHRVSFHLNSHTMTGEVVGTERHMLANGVHDILEIELENEKKQVKIQIHRQAVKLLD